MTATQQLCRASGCTEAELLESLTRGARVGAYPCVASCVLFTFTWMSRPVVIHRPSQRYRGCGWPITVTILFGWWGLPWGPLKTVQALWRTVNGGFDLTNEITQAVASNRAIRASSAC